MKNLSEGFTIINNKITRVRKSYHVWLETQSNDGETLFTELLGTTDLIPDVYWQEWIMKDENNYGFDIINSMTNKKYMMYCCDYYDDHIVVMTFVEVGTRYEVTIVRNGNDHHVLKHSTRYPHEAMTFLVNAQETPIANIEGKKMKIYNTTGRTVELRFKPLKK